MLKRIALALLFIDFMALSAWATWEVGYFGIFAVAASGPGEAQVFADLCVALTFGCAWMVGDARKRGVTVWPWLLAVPFLGSIPVITYAVAREFLPAPAPQATSATA